MKSITITKDYLCDLIRSCEGNSDDVVELLLTRTLEPEDAAQAQTIRQSIKNEIGSRWTDSYFIGEEGQTWADRKGADF